MRVMHVISGLRNGGAEAILARLVTRDTDDEHTVVSMMADEYHGVRLRERGVEVIELDMPPGGLTFNGSWRLFRLIRRRRPEIVQTWMYHADLVGGTIARLAGRRRVFWGLHHTTLDPQQTSLTIRLIARLCAIASWAVPTRMVSCSEEGVRVHSKLGYRRAGFVVIPNGYDITEFAPAPEARAAERERLDIAEGTTLLGMVGRWHEQKDHENLLRALAVLRGQRATGWRCLMVGPGVDENNDTLRSSRANKELDSLVSLCGPTDDVPRLMNAIDLLVLPSAFGEAFPNVVAEAMACGTPCLVTDVGDAALMVGNTGWVVPPSDPAALAGALAAALDLRDAGSEKWGSRQKRCVARVREHFSLERMVSAYRDVWTTNSVSPEPRQPAAADHEDASS